MPGKRTEENQIGWETVSDRLRRIVNLLNSKREDLVKRLREGNQVWEKRKKQHAGSSDAEHPQPQIAKIEWDDDRAENNRRPRRIRRDDEFPSGADIISLKRSSGDSERERKVVPG